MSFTNNSETIMQEQKLSQAEVKNNTKDLVRYGVQLAMLNRLLSHKLMTEKEYHKISEQLRSDYKMEGG